MDIAEQLDAASTAMLTADGVLNTARPLDRLMIAVAAALSEYMREQWSADRAGRRDFPNAEAATDRQHSREQARPAGSLRRRH